MPGLLKNVPKDHPRLLGSREYLQGLAKSRAAAYAKVVDIARNFKTTTGHDDHGMRGKLMAMNLVSAIEGDAKLGREAFEMVRKVYLDQPIRTGHISFGADCGNLALNYDLCHPYWDEKDRQRYFDYFHEARRLNVGEEPSVYHNGWYGMKSAGFINTCLATMYENPRAEATFEEINAEYHARAVPALKTGGNGGGFCEGYYTHYWIYEWIVCCHILETCAKIDYFATAPEFYANRAISSIFEYYPTFREGGSRRPHPCGDSGGRQLHPERDKSLTAVRILANKYKDDPAHQAVHAYCQQVPNPSFNFSAYRNFLWVDPAVKTADLKKFKLSHFSPGPGYVHARESWDEDSTYFFFHCGKRFTAHQHLDNGHFLIFKFEELLGDGGSYEWNTPHGINYYIRTIAHSTMLIHDPDEKLTDFVRAAKGALNDGGQKYPWIGTPWGHNGAAWDLDMWKKYPELGEIGDVVGYEDHGSYMYCAGDATKAYSEQKCELFTRQIVFLRPETFVIFDRVRATQPHFKKKFVLQCMNKPYFNGTQWEMYNGYGKLWVQTLAPAKHETQLFHREDQYKYGGQYMPYEQNHSVSPDCRMEVSPAESAKEDFFVHVISATDYNRGKLEPATVKSVGDEVIVSVLGADVAFKKSVLGGGVTLNGTQRAFGSVTPMKF